MDMEMDESSSIGVSSTFGIKRKLTSLAWEYFERFQKDGKQKGRCLKCKKEYEAGNSGTSNMLRHIIKCRDGEKQADYVPLDHDKYREKLSISIVKHNYPFSYVEHEGTRELHRFLKSEVKPLTRNTAKADVLKIYEKEKYFLRSELASIPGRVCLSTYLWTSITTDSYMTLTAHYVDKNWDLQKKILIFRHVPPPHSGSSLAKKVNKYLKEWGLEKKVFTVTLDNAKYNDVLVDKLKDQLLLSDGLVCNGEFLHIRCSAHKLNLIVQDGLKMIDEVVYKIRESVKYVRGSEKRKLKFATCIAHVSLRDGMKLCQDVPTRWNSTYLMLSSATSYRRAFSQLQLIDTKYETCPTSEEWAKAERITKFLKPFYEITTLFSRTKYPTANLYFFNVWKIQVLIQSEMESQDDNIASMAKEMKEKFDKYWDCYCAVLSFVVVLDPRYKFKMMSYCLEKLYPATFRERVKTIKRKLSSLFHEYMYSSTFASENHASLGGSASKGGDDSGDELEEFDSYEDPNERSNISKSQLDLYLEEKLVPRKQNAKMDVLLYWKEHELKYPELSLMARDLLSVPITSVASESAFSVGNQIISKYRASLVPKIVEVLVCTHDWLCDLSGLHDADEEGVLTEDFSHLLVSESDGASNVIA